jgi:hypothetical protein
MPAGADNMNESTPAAHRYVPTPEEIAAAPPKKKPARIRKQNGQRIGSQRNSSTKASRKRITSLIKQQVARDRALLQHVNVNDKIKVKIHTVEPQFTYNFFQPKGKARAHDNAGQRAATRDTIVDPEKEVKKN